MARIFQTGFETGTKAQLFDSNALDTIITTTPRGSWSGYCLNTGNSGVASDLLDSAVSEFYFGFGFRPTASTAGCGVQFKSPNGTEQCNIATTSGNQLTIRRVGTVLATGSQVLVPNTWYYIECHIVIHGSTGTCQVKIDGIVDIATTTGLNTKNDGSSGTVDRIRYTGVGSDIRFDDIYMNDTTGAVNDGYSGDTKVTAYIPNAEGSNIGLTPSTGTDNSALVDERPANTTDYNSSAVVDDYDLYALPNTSGAQDIQAVRVWAYAKKSDAGTGLLAPVVKTAAGTATGVDQALSTSYTFYHQDYDKDPNDSAAWTTTKVDALEVGWKAR